MVGCRDRRTGVGRHDSLDVAGQPACRSCRRSVHAFGTNAGAHASVGVATDSPSHACTCCRGLHSASSRATRCVRAAAQTGIGSAEPIAPAATQRCQGTRRSRQGGGHGRRANGSAFE
jgi:hypothetical protein